MPAAPYGQGQPSGAPYDDEPGVPIGTTTWLEAGPYREPDPAYERSPSDPVDPYARTTLPRATEPVPFTREERDGLDWFYAPTVSRYLLNGLLASVVGTIVLGIILQAMGLMTAIAAATDVSIPSVWFVLFVVHILLGFVLGFVLATDPRSRPLTGILFGLAVWVVWGMIALPVWLDQAHRILDFSENRTWMLSIAYLAYGFVAGLVAWYMEPRTELREVRGFRPMPARY